MGGAHEKNDQIINTQFQWVKLSHETTTEATQIQNIDQEKKTRRPKNYKSRSAKIGH